MKYTMTAYRRYKSTEPFNNEYVTDYYMFAEEFEVAEHPDWVFGISGSEECNWAYRLQDLPAIQAGEITCIQYGWSNWGPYWKGDPYIFQQLPEADPDFQAQNLEMYSGLDLEAHPYMEFPEGVLDQPELPFQELIDKIKLDPFFYWDGDAAKEAEAERYNTLPEPPAPQPPAESQLYDVNGNPVE